MYHPYRGQRSQRNKMIRNAVIVLLCLFIVACAVFLLFFQDGFRQWREEYMQSHPKKEQTTQQESVPEEENTPTEENTENTDSSAQQDTAQPQQTAQSLKTLEIPKNKLGDEAYLQQVVAMQQQGKINAVAILMKEEEGTLTYPSALEELQGSAILANTSSNVQTALSTLKAAGLHTTAIVNAYKDNLYPRQNANALLKNNSGKPWIRETKRCMDPTAEASVTYLTNLIKECGTLGFDEVVLYQYGWPDGGATSKINYGENTDLTARAATLSAQLQSIVQNTAPVQVSVCLQDEEAQTGIGITGQSLARMYPYAAHLYIPMTEQTAVNAEAMSALAAQTGGDTAKLIPMYTNSELASDLFSGTAAMYFAGDIES